KELKKLKKRWRYPREKKKVDLFSHVVFPQEKVNGVWVYKIESNRLLIKQGSAVEQSKRNLAIKLKYHRPIQGKIKTLTVAWKNNKYYANFSCQLPKPKQLSINEIKRQLGIDIGIAEKLKKLYHSLSRKQHKRNESDLTKNSKHFEKARLRLMKAFRKVARRINDRNHKLSRKIVDKFDLIAYEDLKLSKTFEKRDKKRKFSKYTVEELSRLKIADFFTKLDYKAKLKGKIPRPVDPSNTSKRCFECGKINQDLEKRRWFICASPLCDYE
ncbi:18957_t:CDS:2, partial [Racocetra persica]